MDFIRYPKVRQLGAVENHGIFDLGDIYIFEKIDGANAQIRNIDGKAVVGRRSGFVSDVDTRFIELKQWAETLEIEKLDSNLIIFGEWLIRHTVSYPEDKYNKFYAFDVFNISDQRLLPYEETVPIYESLGIDYLKPWYIGKYQNMDHVKSFVGKTDFGAEQGEGIVIKNYAFLNRFRVQSHAKLVREDFKEDLHGKIESERKVEQERRNKEREIAEQIITDVRIKKIYDKGKFGELDVEFCGDMRDMKWLPTYVTEDALEENSHWLVTNFDIIDMKRIRKVATGIVADWLKQNVLL